uniref:Uncharacterized protein n=1 Tax=Oryza sativa subsp. japonica TaxID=39947 RepID=Q8LGV6_ORYSJ|nr:hypothetical protein [Oryza sativa Japonica Group]
MGAWWIRQSCERRRAVAGRRQPAPLGGGRQLDRVGLRPSAVLGGGTEAARAGSGGVAVSAAGVERRGGASSAGDYGSDTSDGSGW